MSAALHISSVFCEMVCLSLESKQLLMSRGQWLYLELQNLNRNKVNSKEMGPFGFTF